MEHCVLNVSLTAATTDEFQNETSTNVQSTQLRINTAPAAKQKPPQDALVFTNELLCRTALVNESSTYLKQGLHRTAFAAQVGINTHMAPPTAMEYRLVVH